MNEVSRTAVSDTATVPPIACASWCEDGTGHPGAAFVEDQFCLAHGQPVELTREAPEQLGGQFYRHEIATSLERDDPFSEPFLSLGFDDTLRHKVTRGESVALVEQIMRLWGLVDGEAAISQQRLCELVDGATGGAGQ